jgi:hypothetical protein
MPFIVCDLPRNNTKQKETCAEASANAEVATPPA